MSHTLPPVRPAEAVPMAERFLALIEGLAEYDDHAASHLLIGLLRIAAGQRLHSVERTALRIAGLANTTGDDLHLTEEGYTLVALISPDAASRFAPIPLSDSAAYPANDAATFDPQPFARMRFGDELFEIAEGAVEDSLAFRRDGEGPWQMLSNDRSAGWDVIGGEMLAATRDIVADYIMMHTVRLAAPELGAGVHRFELDQFHWHVRVTATTAELRIGEDGAWQLIPDSIRETSVRALGIRAAQAMIPDFVELLQPEITIWVRRMAHAAAISPVMPNAA